MPIEVALLRLTSWLRDVLIACTPSRAKLAQPTVLEMFQRRDESDMRQAAMLRERHSHQVHKTCYCSRRDGGPCAVDLGSPAIRRAFMQADEAAYAALKREGLTIPTAACQVLEIAWCARQPRIIYGWRLAGGGSG